MGLIPSRGVLGQLREAEYFHQKEGSKGIFLSKKFNQYKAEQLLKNWGYDHNEELSVKHGYPIFVKICGYKVDRFCDWKPHHATYGELEDGGGFILCNFVNPVVMTTIGIKNIKKEI